MREYNKHTCNGSMVYRTVSRVLLHLHDILLKRLGTLARRWDSDLSLLFTCSFHFEAPSVAIKISLPDSDR